MTLANGRHHLAIPGPSVMPDRVLRAMHRAAPNIYEGELVDMVPGIVADLRRVAGTAHHATIYIANGHGVWEAALSNTHSRGDKVLVLATGRFAHGWAELAGRLGVDCQIIDFPRFAAIDPEAVARALEADRDHAIKSVLMTQVDTATTVLSDVQAVRAAIDAAGHPALLMVDCIASLGCDRYEMDAWGVDLTVAACQKGLMTPPGMGYVFFNDKANAARDRAGLVTPYWDWRARSRPEEFYQYFFGTAPTHHLFGQREALDMIAEEGLQAIWHRHDRLARAVWAACEAWGAEGALRLNVGDPAARSRAVTSVRLGGPVGLELRQWLAREAGVTLGIGLGMSEPEDPRGHGYFRIAHMGHVNTHMVLGTLGAIEAGLVALNIPHGTGAVAAAARVCAGG